MRWSGTALFWLATTALAGCHTQAEAPPPRTLVRLMSYGGNNPLADAVAAEYTRALSTVTVTRMTGDQTSADTIEGLQRGTADLGFALADAAYLAYLGRLENKLEPARRLRGIALMQLASLHLLVNARSNIHRVTDLRGRRVRMGPRQTDVPSAADTALVATLMLRAFGVRTGDVRLIDLPLADAVDYLVDGRLDAVFVNANDPSTIVQSALTRGARLVPIDGPEVDSLLDEYPFVRSVTIPAGLYPGQDTHLVTIGVNVVFLCRDDLSEALVYDLTRAFFEALPTLSTAQTSLRFMDPEQAPATPIPLHEGAARYYRESELFR